MLGAFALVVLSACLHAGWNLLAHRRRAEPSIVLRIPLYVGLAGALPAALSELGEPLLSPRILGLLALTGAAQALYYAGLTRAYASSDFSLIYPLSRALPVLVLAAIDLARGRGLTPLGIAGMLLVGAGCVAAPGSAPRGIPPGRRRESAALWLAVITLATVIYTMADKLALEDLPRRTSVAARYSVWEALATLPFLRAMAARGWTPGERPDATARAPWWWTAAAAACSAGSYGLVLCAYQFSAHVSHVAALRQVSIPLGVVASRALLGERVSASRAAAAVVIAAGVGCVLAGGS